MVSKLEAIRAELKAISDWDRSYAPRDTLDEIGKECRRIRRDELLSVFYWLVEKN